MSFSWVCAPPFSYNGFGFSALFPEHCNYYSKKGAGSQEKNDLKIPKLRLPAAIMNVKKFLFCPKNEYLEFLRVFSLYIV